jgi:branched-chain amino acid transport system permease protein
LQMGFVGPTGYGFALSIQMLFGLVIGGMNSIAGAIVGGLFLEFLPGLVASLGKGLSAVLFAVLLIAGIVAMPNGVVGGVTETLPRLAARLRRLFSSP